MKESYLIQYRDPTAWQAINNVSRFEKTRPTDQENTCEPSNLSSSDSNATLPEQLRRQESLTELNRRYPGERKKPIPRRNPDFMRLREAIMRGNFDVFTENCSGKEDIRKEGVLFHNDL